MRCNIWLGAQRTVCGPWGGGFRLTYAVVDVQVFDRLLVIGYFQVQVDVGDETRIFSAHRDRPPCRCLQ